MKNGIMAATRSLNWLQVAAALPAALMLWSLLVWNPKGRRQWIIASGMMIYVAGYYVVFVRGH